MHPRERFLIYGALLLLGGANATALLGGGSPRALAEDDEKPAALGPAASLSLAGGDGELVLRNEAGHLAWGDTEYARAYSIAFVHVGRTLGPLLEAEHYTDEYRRMEEEIRSVDEEIGERIQAFIEEHKDVQPGDPNAERVQRAYQELLQERERWRLEGTQRLGQLASTQIEQAYREMIDAVEVVAERRGIDLVLRFIPTANPFEATAPAQSYIGIRARIALKYPEGLDITDAVLEELAVE